MRATRIASDICGSSRRRAVYLSGTCGDDFLCGRSSLLLAKRFFFVR